MTAVAALTERTVRAALRDDLPFAVLAPVGNFVVFTFLLRNIIDTGPMSYPQYVMPAIVIQTMLLGALTTVDRAATDRQSEFGIRLGTLPISAAAPLTARMLYCLVRAVVSLLASVVIAYAFGFRMFGGVGYAVAFLVVVLLFTLALSLAADAAGSRAGRADAGTGSVSSQLFLAPQMLLVMLSTGMAPVESFPEWLHPFVRYQPVSEVTEALRGFTVGQVSIGSVTATMAWCLGMLITFGALAVRMQRRTQ